MQSLYSTVKKFLERSLKGSREQLVTQKLESGLPKTVGNEETIARFVFSSSHYNTLGVKPAAFLPNPKNGETSVFRHTELWRDVLIESGKAIARDRGSRFHGTAYIESRIVFDAQLDLKAAEPPPCHANIIGWPVVANDSASQKAKQKECALLIAQAASFSRNT